VDKNASSIYCILGKNRLAGTRVVSGALLQTLAFYLDFIFSGTGLFAPKTVRSRERKFQGRVALSCAPVRALLRTHGLESSLMQRCAHGSAPVGALPWAQPTLCAPDWLNFALICNISDGLLDYAKVIAYLATHSQTNTYQSPQNQWHSSSHSPPAQTSYRLPCWHYVIISRDLVHGCDVSLWSKNTWCAPVVAGVALRSAPKLWRKSLERSLTQHASGVELSLPGTFAPWNFRSLELSLRPCYFPSEWRMERKYTTGIAFVC